MARPIPIAYPGAFYHETSRGNERRDVFKSQHDREKFLSYLQSVTERYRRAYGVCLRIEFTTLLITLTLLTSSVWADGVSVNLIEGNTVIPIQNNNIRMVSEVVKISKDAKVTADFVFENLSDASAPLKMGFPVIRGDDHS